MVAGRRVGLSGLNDGVPQPPWMDVPLGARGGRTDARSIIHRSVRDLE